MPLQRGISQPSAVDASSSEEEFEATSDADQAKPTKRTATVYDAVAGRVGLSGFLKPEQLKNDDLLPSAPEEVLLRRVNAPDQLPFGFYDADERLPADQKLPDSDLLKAIHTYVSEFYDNIAEGSSSADFRSFDETALLALGFLLEEASIETLGENGDMALVEPEGMENEVLESKLSSRQIVGRVVPRTLETKLGTTNTTYSSDDLELEASPRKKRR